jgi:hypothetical protein
MSKIQQSMKRAQAVACEVIEIPSGTRGTLPAGSRYWIFSKNKPFWKARALEEGAEKSTSAASVEEAFGKLRSAAQRPKGCAEKPVRRSC